MIVKVWSKIFISVLLMILLVACGKATSITIENIEVVTVEAKIVRDEASSIGAAIPDGEEIGEIIPTVIQYQIEIRNTGNKDFGGVLNPIELKIEPNDVLLQLLDKNVFQGEYGFSYSGSSDIRTGQSEDFVLNYGLGSEDTTGLEHGAESLPENLEEIKEQALNGKLIVELNGKELKRVELRDYK
jgi:hypothetical protein